jgi:alpha-glucosidase
MAAASAAGEMVWMRVLEEGVFRFDASEAARAAAAPSLSFADPRRREAARDGADAPAVVPACEVAAPGGAQKVVLKVRANRRTQSCACSVVLAVGFGWGL